MDPTTATHADCKPDGDDALVALVDLCEAQRASIAALEHALDEHARRGTPRTALHGVAHATATPLTAIIGLLHLVRSGKLAPDQADDFIARAHRQAEQLAALLDELVEGAEGEVEVPRTPLVKVRLGDVAADALDAARRRLGRRRVEVAVDSSTTVTTLPDRLARVVLLMLLGAARRSRPGAPVTLTARSDERGAVIEVTGCGAAAPAPGDTPVHLDVYAASRLAETLGAQLSLVVDAQGRVVATLALPQRRRGDAPEP